MDNKLKYQNQSPKGDYDYDKELKDVFFEALKKIDPEIIKVIELVQKMEIKKNKEIQVFISNKGSNL